MKTSTKIQFSLRTVLWIILCAGIGMGMYWQGFRAGRNYKEPPPEPQFGHARAYYVEDLLDTSLYEESSQGLDDIRQQIIANVVPASWTDNGGKAQLRVFETNLSLVVMHDESGHEKVAGYLRSLRESVSKSESNSP